MLPCKVEASACGSLPCDGAVTRRILLRLRSCGGLGILLVEHAEDAGSDFVVDDGLVVFTDDVDTEFLKKNVMVSRGFDECGRVHTTMSSLLSSNGSDSRPSALRRSLLMKVPFELLTSLM